MKNPLPKISFIVFLILFFLTGGLLSNSSFLFDDFENQDFRDFRDHRGFMLQINSYIGYQKAVCGDKKRVAVLGDSVFWGAKEEGYEYPGRSVTANIVQKLEDNYCVYNLTTPSTIAFHWYSRIQNLIAKDSVDIIVMPILYPTLLWGTAQTTFETNNDEYVKSFWNFSDLYYMWDEMGWYQRLAWPNYLEEFLPVFKYKRDLVYEFNDAAWGGIHYNNQFSIAQGLNAYLNGQGVYEIPDEGDYRRAGWLPEKYDEGQVESFIQKFVDFEDRIEDSPYWYFYNAIAQTDGAKVLFVTLPFNHEGYDLMEIPYDESILDMKLSNFIEESDNTAILEAFYTDYFTEDKFVDYYHLNFEGNAYLADLIINKLKELQW